MTLTTAVAYCATVMLHTAVQRAAHLALGAMPAEGKA